MLMIDTSMTLHGRTFSGGENTCSGGEMTCSGRENETSKNTLSKADLTANPMDVECPSSTEETLSMNEVQARP
jgi:hypothetical protein